MKVVEYSAFSHNLAENLNMVNEDKEIMIVPTVNGKTVVVMDLDEYNSIQETLHLTGTSANRQRIEDAIAEMNQGVFLNNSLVDTENRYGDFTRSC